MYTAKQPFTKPRARGTRPSSLLVVALTAQRAALGLARTHAGGSAAAQPQPHTSVQPRRRLDVATLA